MSETPETVDNPAAPAEENEGGVTATPEAGDGADNDLTAEDANAVPSAAEPDEMEGTAEATNDGLEHDPENPETEPGVSP